MSHIFLSYASSMRYVSYVNACIGSGVCGWDQRLVSCSVMYIPEASCTYEWVMSKHVAELYPIYECVYDFGSWWTGLALVSCSVSCTVTHVSELCLINEGVHRLWSWWMGLALVSGDVSCTWMSHVTHMNESCHAYHWVTSHIWMSHVACVEKLSDILYMNASIGSEFDRLSWLLCFALCCVHEWVTSHMCIIHVTHVNELYLINEGVHRLWSWWMGLALVSCDVSCTWMSRLPRVNESGHTYHWVTSHIWMSHVACAEMNESPSTCEWVMSHIWGGYGQ